MNTGTKEFLHGFAKKAALISGVFTLFVAVLMLSDHLRAKGAFASAEPKLDAMRAQITKTPEDEALKRDFSRLELVYRRAYFVNDRQFQTGSTLLLAGIGVFFAMCVTILQTAPVRPEMPEKDALKERAASDARFRKILLGTAALGVLGLAAYFLAPGGKESAPPPPAYAALEEIDANWTSLRGPRNDGVARNFSMAPGSRLEEAWKAEIPSPGFNSPVAFGDKIFLSGATAEARSIFCYSQEDGRLLWRADATGPAKSNYDDQSGPAPSTVTTDGMRVYAVFPTGELVCASVEGKLLYVKNFGTPEILYAYASSPIVCGRELVVQMYLEKTRTLYALDSATGREIWKSEKGADTSWSSPSLVTAGGRKIVAVSSCSGIEAYDLETGAELWRQNCLSGEVAASVTAHDGKIFAASEGASALALDALDGKILWQNDSLILPSVASPVFAGGELYVFSSGGTVSRVNAESGELVREYDCDEGFYSSPVSLGESIMSFNNGGKMFLSEAGDGFSLGEPAADFGEAVYASPAFSNSMVFVRVGSALHGFKILKP